MIMINLKVIYTASIINNLNLNLNSSLHSLSSFQNIPFSPKLKRALVV